MSALFDDTLFAGLVLAGPEAAASVPAAAPRRLAHPLSTRPRPNAASPRATPAEPPVPVAAVPAPPVAAPPVSPSAPPEAPALAPLLVRDDVWRGRTRMRGARGEPTGHPALDALLPDGGWPRGALTEILHARDGVGELQLVLPTLAALTRRGERVVWVAPPYTPCAMALAQRGVVLDQLVVLRPSGQQDTLWAIEQCLRSGAVGAVLAWPGRVDTTTLRRLALAAEAGGALGFVWRDVRAAHESSPAALRLVAQREYAREQVRVLRCRGLLTAPGHAVDLVA
jgi:hypothetical protein